MKNINEIIERLKASPMYNLSLSSKELFHSNFLAWLCVQEPEVMGRIFSQVLGRENAMVQSDTVLREKKNIDLQFKFDDGQTVILENKVKSLPYPEQLLEYAEKYRKVENVDRILLTLSDPKHLYEQREGRQEILVSGAEDESYSWKLLTYEELAGLLDTNRFDDKYHPFIEDYINFIEGLSDFEKHTRVSKNGAIQIGGSEKFDLTNSPILKALKASNVRLADFYSKRVAEQLQVLLRQSEATHEEDVMNSSIVRGDKAEVRVYRKLSERIQCSLELCLDGAYRKVIHVKHVRKEKRKKLAYLKSIDVDEVFVKLKDNTNWFEFDEVPNHRRDDSYQQTKAYLSFKNDARYMQIKINASTSYDEIIQIFETGLNSIDSLKHLLQEYDSPAFEEY